MRQHVMWVVAFAAVLGLEVEWARGEGRQEAEAAQQAASKLWDEGKWEEALTESNKAVAASPEWHDALMLRARVRERFAGAEGVAAEKAVRLLAGALADLKSALALNSGKPLAERRNIRAKIRDIKKQLVAVRLKAEPCVDGMARGPDTAGYCCWPGQKWSKGKERCSGVPTCPEGTKAQGDACKGEVLIKGGTYTRGRKKVEVKVADFYLDKTEVTVGAYQACVSEGKCPSVESIHPQCNTDKDRATKHPITCVTWHEAKDYCEKHGGRLPTEEEWEWAARGREEGRKYPWGNDAPPARKPEQGRTRPFGENPPGQPCWDCRGCFSQSTCAAGSRPADLSRDGVRDLAGNVSEWTSTVHERNPGGRVVRGGSWSTNHTRRLSAAFRRRSKAEHRDVAVGFRCARTP